MIMTENNTVLTKGASILREYLVLVMIAALVVITAIVEPKFASGANLVNIMRQFGPLIMVSLGMTFVIIGGFIDLSVAGTINLVAVVTISLIQPMGQVPALLVGLTIGAVCGAVNSFLILSSGAPDTGRSSLHHLRHEHGLLGDSPPLQPRLHHAFLGHQGQQVAFRGDRRGKHRIPVGILRDLPRLPRRALDFPQQDFRRPGYRPHGRQQDSGPPSPGCACRGR